MHELSVTKGILKICIEEGERYKVKEINKVNIKVGELTGLVPNCIAYYFNIVAKGTIAEGAEILIEKIPVSIHCEECGFEGELGKNNYYCPKCSGSKYKIIKGREFYLDTMEVD
jgi:hydrogenase nickel incorporation protein HypA/HybF